MNLQKLDIITLNDNKSYLVVTKTILNDINFYCIMDTDETTNIKFCKEDNDKLIEIEDHNLIQTLIKKIYVDVIKN